MGLFARNRPVCPHCGRRIYNIPSAREILGKLAGLRFNFAFNLIILAVISIAAGIVSLMLGATVYGMPMFWSYFSSPALLLLNLLPPLLLVMLMHFIFGRAWIAFAFPSAIILTLSVGAFFKFQVRSEPLFASDIGHFREASSVASSYALTMNWKVTLAAALLILGSVFSFFILKHKPKSLRLRVIVSLAILAASASLYSFVYSSKPIYDRLAADIMDVEWSAARKYISTGFMYPFIHSASESRPRRPSSYNRNEARQFLESYGNPGIPEDRRVNIICLMLEAYADFSVFGVLDFTEDVYGPLHELQSEAISGSLITNVFGGGTIDTERLFLTGNTYLTNYRSPTNSYVYYLRSQSYHTEGLHAGDIWFYDRRPINASLGFDEYYFMEDFENGSRDDSFFFPTVRELYDARDASRPYFSFNLSYQNHGAYESAFTKEPYFIERGGVSDEAFNILNNYLSGIYDTTLRLAQFIDSLRSDPEPVIVVAFGDHMPWMGAGDFVYAELGINVDAGTDEGFYNYYSTPYVIWANGSAKELLGNDFTGDGESFSTCFLLGEVFRLCSWAGEGYMQALREFGDTVDIIGTTGGVFRENGALTMELSEQAKAAYWRLKMIEYYRMKNFMY